MKKLLVASALLLAPLSARAQDTFEIQVYEYATVPKGKWNLETHFNYTAKGTTVAEGTVAPSEKQSHLTFELTRGITDRFEMAAYLVTAKRDGVNPELVGYRLRPRMRFPDTWPVLVSISAEVGFPKDTYEENSTTLEFRPILERSFGKLAIDVNPVLGRALKGPGKDEGWDFEPGVRVGYDATKKLALSVEYYGATGELTDPLPSKQQVHQFFPGGDWQINDNIVFNFGVGFNLNDVGNRLVYKSRLGVMW